MKFLYGTVLGRVFLKILLHTKLLRLLAGFLHTPYSRWLIKLHIRKYQIDMKPFGGQEYENYADFFARRREGSCYVKTPNVWISPCDGELSIVPIKENARFYIKNSCYSIHDLVPDRNLASYFKNGLCLVFRLKADDYHHFCYIDDCYHTKGHLIPGMLHSVQPIALEKKPVFRLNKRVWSLMKTKNFGDVAQIEVGAVLVGGMVHETEEAWVKRGDEMGHFELCGSTIILFFQNEVRERFLLSKDMEKEMEEFGECRVRMGEAIGYLETRLPES